MEKMDRGALIDAAEALVPLSHPASAQLKQLPDDGDVDVPGVTGPVVARIDTPAGAIVIGGKGANATSSTSCPAWPRSSTWAAATRITRARLAGAAGAAGASISAGATLPGVHSRRARRRVSGRLHALNLEGGNRYEARTWPRGPALAGVGILLDFGGNNVIAACAG